MKAKETIQAAIDLILDELDGDPRNSVVLELKKLLEQSDAELPDGTIRLFAVIGPNGRGDVFDQHNRKVEGVKSVACFVDNGQPVFQLNL